MNIENNAVIITREDVMEALREVIIQHVQFDFIDSAIEAAEIKKAVKEALDEKEQETPEVKEEPEEKKETTKKRATRKKSTKEAKEDEAKAKEDEAKAKEDEAKAKEDEAKAKEDEAKAKDEEDEPLTRKEVQDLAKEIAHESTASSKKVRACLKKYTDGGFHTLPDDKLTDFYNDLCDLYDEVFPDAEEE